ncbi:tripartite motif-containing protein 2-like isoform X2 [Rhineura floridana]|uniref:tripartite motif-containing protein 2-like isoform X2 n=1 Tax=Rhineura floridana TaxID=261503 RepID=UPI002AC88F53|nr:tripartite motif-containing protein 2-like isoform X2 [Rhineura floridana]XP_061489402.1 tripartite motif-containing protein 2-like isoform X2 [Rhineura floridana]XP_061489410.1 tripartite motif-containing protein 2-like isoform X2 [Rhineura floridana]
MPHRRKNPVVVQGAMLDSYFLKELKDEQIEQTLRFNNKWKLSGIQKIHYNSLEKILGGFGTIPGKLIWPTSLTTTPEGDLAVKDSGTRQIQIYSADGHTKQRFSYGFEPIKGMGDITCMKNGVLLVTNGTRIIQLFTKDGELIHELKSPKVTWPCSYGIAVLKANKIAVSDWSNGGKVNIIGVDWRMNTILKTHSIEGFHRPVGVAVNKSEEILVTEGQLFGKFQGCCIKIIDRERSVKRTIGPQYGRKFTFENPSGICEDCHGNMFVSDEGQNCIVMFNPDSSLSAVVVSEGLQGPSGLSVMDHGMIAVADCYNHCVKIYRYK